MQELKRIVALIFGGKSVEHEVSIESAKNIFQDLDRFEAVQKLETDHR